MAVCFPDLELDRGLALLVVKAAENVLSLAADAQLEVAVFPKDQPRLAKLTGGGAFAVEKSAAVRFQFELGGAAIVDGRQAANAAASDSTRGPISLQSKISRAIVRAVRIQNEQLVASRVEPEGASNVLSEVPTADFVELEKDLAVAFAPLATMSDFAVGNDLGKK